MKGYIHSIETLAAADGPGIRTAVFMQGCNLRCRYCHNPDTWNREQGTGNREQVYSVDGLFNKLIRYKEYYGKDGGVTASGGEPLLQAEFLTAVFQKLKASGINTALDTAGTVLNDNVKALLDYTDLVILDVKHTESKAYDDICGMADGNLPRPRQEVCAGTPSCRRGIFEKVIDFLEYCAGQKKRIWLRQVIIPNINDSKEQVLELKKLADKYKVEKVELLPYHTMGVSKWEKLGLEYSLKDIPPADEKTIQRLQKTASPTLCRS